MEFLQYACVIGTGATAAMDAWGFARKPLLGLAPPDYGLVGRWIGHMGRGRFRHASIATAPRVHGERLIGWAAHYLIGVTFAALLLAIWGTAWVEQPTLGPALLVGIGTVAAPL